MSAANSKQIVVNGKCKVSRKNALNLEVWNVTLEKCFCVLLVSPSDIKLKRVREDDFTVLLVSPSDIELKRVLGG